MEATAALTAEQREELERQQELAALKTRDGQSNAYRDALMEALTAKNLEIGAQGLQPRIDSVVQALTMLQAEFIAMFPNRNERRMRMAEVETNLKRLVALRSGMSQKPAKPMAPDTVN